MGVFECDELYTVRVLPKLKPTYFVLLNLFRDQLDRYGEIDHTQEVIAHALELSPATTLIYNADDPLCARLPRAFPMRVLPLASTAPPTPSPTALATRAFARSATPVGVRLRAIRPAWRIPLPLVRLGTPALVRRVTA
ncbi:MAG: hypothetical protein ACLU37_06230 [Collinsella sp.]